MASLRVDVHHALRALSRDRGFALVAILVLALGIGANTAIFSLVNGVLLQPLPFRAPQDLVLVREVVPELAHIAPTVAVNARHFLAWQRDARSFESFALLEEQEPTLTGAGDPERLSATRATTDLFALLGVDAQHGRTFRPEDAVSGQERIVILTDAFWRRRFGGDPSILGRTMVLDEAPHTVVGILPAGFQMPTFDVTGASRTREVDLFRPWPIDEKQWGLLGDFNYVAIGRLRAGVTLDRAQAELNVIQSQIAAQLTGNERVTLRAALRPLQAQIVASAQRGLWLLLAAVGSILVIACANVSHLFLVRATTRRHDSAIRAALGASSWQLARQALVEGLCLAFAGGAAGVLVALVALRLLVQSAPVDVPRLHDVRLDASALTFSLVVATLAGLVCSLTAAWRQTRTDPQEALRASSRSATETRGGGRVRALLVSLEVGVSTALLIVAALLMASFLHVMRLDKGFDVERILTADITLTGPTYRTGERRSQFYADLVTRLGAMPETTSSGLVTTLPLQPPRWSDVISLEGDTRPILQRPIAPYRAVAGGYFQTMGIPVKLGRVMTEGDRPRAVAVVSASTAQRIWPGQNPIGKHFRRGNPNEPPFEVIGIVGDVKISLEGEPEMMVYVPYWRRNPNSMNVVLRTTGDPGAMTQALKDAVWSLDPALPLGAVQTMTQIERRHVSQRRFQTLLVGAFATVALLLAALGVYSIVAYTVAGRTRELGLRLALGARPGQVMMLVMRQGLRPVVIGLACGVAAALALGRFVSALLFGVTASDPLTLAGVAAFILAATTAACWVPTRRISAADPMDALRVE